MEKVSAAYAAKLSYQSARKTRIKRRKSAINAHATFKTSISKPTIGRASLSIVRVLICFKTRYKSAQHRSKMPSGTKQRKIANYNI